MKVTYFGPYGEMAARHMARWRPNQYASIPEWEREEYFLALDETVAQAIRDREHFSTPPSNLAEADPVEYQARMNMSHLAAEEEIVAEMVLLPPEPEALAALGEPDTDQNGAYLDPGWRSTRLELSDEEWEAQQRGHVWTPITRTELGRS